MVNKPYRKPYDMFKGVNDSCGIIELSEKLSNKMELKLDKKKSLSTIPVLRTKTNLNEIS
jgi:hypothetical protein